MDNNRADRSSFDRMSFSPARKELRLGASIGHGQDELQKYMSNPNCFNQSFLSSIVMTDNYATVISYETGLYWVFSLGKATLIEANNIFKKITPEMIAKGGFKSALLLAQPEKEGTVLIAAQEEDFFINNNSAATADVYMEMAEMRLGNPSMTQEEYERLLSVRLKEQRKNSPFIAWHRLYPENGKVEKLTEPPKGGAYLMGDNDSWRPMPDGSVKMEITERILFENMQKNAKVDEPAKELGQTKTH